MTRLEILAGLLSALALFIAWDHWHSLKVGEREGIAAQVAAEKRAAAKQQAKDDAVLLAAKDAHAKEIAELDQHYAAALPVSVRCYPSTSRVPAAGLPLDRSPAPVMVQHDAEVHPDITGPLRVLLGRADRLSADARELNAAVH